MDQTAFKAVLPIIQNPHDRKIPDEVKNEAVTKTIECLTNLGANVSEFRELVAENVRRKLREIAGNINPKILVKERAENCLFAFIGSMIGALRRYKSIDGKPREFMVAFCKAVAAMPVS